MNLGQTKQLDLEDVWPLRNQQQAEPVSMQFASLFERNKSITKSFLHNFGLRFALTGAAFLLSMLCNLVGPMVLEHVISSLMTHADQLSLVNISYWVLALFLAQVVQTLADSYANFETELIAIQLISALKTMLYRKSLRLSAESRKQKSVGEITTIYTSDSDSVLAAAYYVHQAWLIPIQITVVSIMLYRLLGVAAVAGIGVILVTMYLNQIVSRRMFARMLAYRSSIGERMKRVTEAFKAISIVKFSSWEDKFLERIGEARTIELQNLLARNT